MDFGQNRTTCGSIIGLWVMMGGQELGKGYKERWKSTVDPEIFSERVLV